MAAPCAERCTRGRPVCRALHPRVPHAPSTSASVPRALCGAPHALSGAPTLRVHARLLELSFMHQHHAGPKGAQPRWFQQRPRFKASSPRTGLQPLACKPSLQCQVLAGIVQACCTMPMHREAEGARRLHRGGTWQPGQAQGCVPAACLGGQPFDPCTLPYQLP